jgi:hypothetical protein
VIEVDGAGRRFGATLAPRRPARHLGATALRRRDLVPYLSSLAPGETFIRQTDVTGLPACDPEVRDG